MKVSIDTNVWIFGIVGADEFSEKVLLNLSKFRIIIPDQVREARFLMTLNILTMYGLNLQVIHIRKAGYECVISLDMRGK
ncbi:MAG: hypothetical protein GY749_01315 [Desulfobacteraceae bacterium]|nr:hypothetical protein [Desulfobacteraceae bacterium]